MLIDVGLATGARRAGGVQCVAALADEVTGRDDREVDVSLKLAEQLYRQWSRTAWANVSRQRELARNTQGASSCPRPASLALHCCVRVLSQLVLALVSPCRCRVLSDDGPLPA